MDSLSTEEIYGTRLSVREFVEFTLRHGDLDSRGRAVDPRAMNEGTRLHQKIQRSKPDYYTPEVPISLRLTCEYEGELFSVTLDGRADGIIKFPSMVEKFASDNPECALFESEYFIDEIKCMYADVEKFKEPNPLHLAQAKLYALSLCRQNKLEKVGVMISYCNIETEKLRYFTFEYSISELEEWIAEILPKYVRFLHFELHHIKKRDATIEEASFPFEYREGQRELVKNVYLSIAREKKLFLMAPTGVGKTMATVFPAIKSLGEGKARKLFYTTSKTITRSVAEEAFSILKGRGMDILNITLTAKDKVCILDKPECNPEACERAKGHEDRVNDAVYDLITNEKQVTRDIILAYAAKHQVCPFEFALDVSLWCDAIICDYNYCFDPDVFLRRFFNDANLGRFLLLCDESHNLVDRARECYSAEITKEIFTSIKPHLKGHEELWKPLNKVARALKQLQEENPGYFAEIDYDENIKVFSAISKCFDALHAYVINRKSNPDDETMDFYFELRKFVMTAELMDEKYVITLSSNGGDAILRLQCMNPKRRLATYLAYHRSAIFFSATLLPVNYYKEQLSGNEEDYAVYAPSPFDQNNRKVLIATDVSARYNRRNEEEYIKFAQYLDTFIRAKTGNYLIFFPSYKVMSDITRILEAYGNSPFDESKADYELLIQTNSMSELEREEFLEAFVPEPSKSLVGCCVMGGIFSEGIDLKADRLIGVAIVGTGLPMVGDERELFKRYYDDVCAQGFEYSYLYPGMNKVLQAGGRVIRTESDRGVVLLLDDRFLYRQYRDLFPTEWNNYERVRKSELSDKLNVFWNEKETKNG